MHNYLSGKFTYLIIHLVGTQGIIMVYLAIPMVYRGVPMFSGRPVIPIGSLYFSLILMYEIISYERQNFNED